MTTNNWFVIVNPEAGSGKGIKHWPAIKKELHKAGIFFSFAFTERKFHAVELTVSAIKKGYRKIISVGGDGTLNEIANGLFIQKKVEPTEVTIGVIGVGTGNDWQRTHDIPNNYAKMIGIIKRGKSMLQDVGEVSFFESRVSQTRYFVNAAGTGFDAQVALNTNRLKESGHKGKLLYKISLLKSLWKYKCTSLHLSINNKEYSSKMFSLMVGIGKYNGGGMMQAPNAITNDGLFEITLVKKISRLSFIKNIKRLFDGTLLEHPKVESYRSNSFSISTRPASNLEADGESLGTSPFKFSILPKSLKIIVM
ncbi:MAG: diacylglycerol/lipid kinase family protein [Bacteroidales bacterium]